MVQSVGWKFFQECLVIGSREFVHVDIDRKGYSYQYICGVSSRTPGAISSDYSWFCLNFNNVEPFLNDSVSKLLGHAIGDFDMSLRKEFSPQQFFSVSQEKTWPGNMNLNTHSQRL